MAKFRGQQIKACIKTGILFGTFGLYCNAAQATWWIEADNLPLRADIQLLADTGIITQPVTTYPLMWAGIHQELQIVEPSALSSAQLSALERINKAYLQSQAQTQVDLSLGAATDTTRFIGFGQSQRDKAELNVNAQVNTDWFSGRLSASQHVDPTDGNSTRLDNSFAAIKLGNWIVRAGAVPHFWGPGWDSGLIFTTNARPMPGVTLSRNNSHAFTHPALNWTGPWTFTTSFSQMESERFVPDTQHWGARGTIRPVPQLEVGVSWTMQWGGEGYGNSLSDWWDGLFNGGKNEADLANGQENMMAGYDFRWSGTAWGLPYGIYFERISEDYHNEKNRLINAANLGGIDIQLSAINTRIFAEYSDTKVACGLDSQSYNCIYDHGFYRSGSRYYGRSLGSTYDNDSEILVIGAITQLEHNKALTHKVRWLRLNTDAIDTAPPGGSTVSRGEYERVYQIESNYQAPIYAGVLKLGATLSYHQFVRAKTQDWDASAYARWERRF